MAPAHSLNVDDDYSYLISFLPDGWQEQARRLGALKRCRKIPDAAMLLRLLLVHLAEGCSLRETAARFRQGGLLSLSDVAVMDRLRQAGDWFCWLNQEMLRRWVVKSPEAVFPGFERVRIVDATRINEPGPTGSNWCVHYKIDLATLRCLEVHVRDRRGNGETFRQFMVQPGELWMGDRVYGTPASLAHALNGGAAVLVRLAWNLLPLWQADGSAFELLPHLRMLQECQLGDWPVIVRHQGQEWPGRVCAVRRSRQAAEREIKRIRLRAWKKGYKLTRPETLETAQYVFIFTTVPAEQSAAGQVLEMYRGRWQIELVFKRLKSLMGFGHLKKKDPQLARAWIEGKLLVAILVEALMSRGQSFSPWGYPLARFTETPPLPLA